MSLITSPLATEFGKSSSDQKKDENIFLLARELVYSRKDGPEPWFLLNFGDNFISVDSCSFGMVATNTKAPIHWRLRGTNHTSVLKKKRNQTEEDGKGVWTLLYDSKDVVLKKDGMHEFEVKDTGKLFCIFEFSLVKNEWNDWEKLTVSGFELYGTLKQTNVDPTTAQFSQFLRSLNRRSVNAGKKNEPSVRVMDYLGAFTDEVINVFSSTLEKGRSRQFVSKKKFYMWSKNEPNAWFAVGKWKDSLWSVWY